MRGDGGAVQANCCSSDTIHLAALLIALKAQGGCRSIWDRRGVLWHRLLNRVISGRCWSFEGSFAAGSGGRRCCAVRWFLHPSIYIAATAVQPFLAEVLFWCIVLPLCTLGPGGLSAGCHRIFLELLSGLWDVVLCKVTCRFMHGGLLLGAGAHTAAVSVLLLGLGTGSIAARGVHIDGLASFHCVRRCSHLCGYGTSMGLERLGR